MNKFKSFLILSFVLVIALSCSRQEQRLPAIDLTNMDTEICPGDDFFRFANGGWLVANPIPDQYSRYGSFDQLREANDEQLRDLILKISADRRAAAGSNRQKIRDFYNSAMDTLYLESAGIEPLIPFMERIHAIGSIDQLAEEFAFFHQMGVRPWFGVYATQDRRDTDWNIANIGQGGLGMSDRDYYLLNDTRNSQIREAYQAMMIRMFELAGYSPDEAELRMKVVMNMESFMAEASMDRVTRRNPYATFNMMSVDELKKLIPDFNWDVYFAGIGIEIEEINVASLDFFSKTGQMLNKFDVEDWKTYMEWNLIRSSSSFLTRDFELVAFEFYGKVMTGTQVQQERWKRAVANLNGVLGEAVGQEYVADYFPPAAKHRMVDLVEHLRVAFDQRISELDWMSQETKEQAHAKLASMNVKIGYPDKWIDYSPLEIKNQHYLLNMMAGSIFTFNRNMGKVGQPVDRDEWFMSPQTVNAYYSPTMNEIVFPAGILQPPFFFMDADDAVNFGAIGMVIGHEMTHGFDDSGRQYDLQGNLRDWWTKEDAERFTKRSEILVEQYNNYVILDSLRINGRLSLGENIADLGGLTIAFQGLQNKLAETGTPEPIDGFTAEQRFFLAYAQVWRNHIRDQELMRQINEGPHSPGEARVNGIVYNMESFYQAFGLEQNTGRYIAPEKRAAIW
jgi:putative endopeptidase